MNEEEKQTVEELKGCIFFWQGQAISSDNEEDLKIAEKEISINKTILNLIEKLQKENEELRENYISAQACANMVFDKVIPVQKVKDKIEELNRKIDKSIDNSKGGLDEEFIEKSGELLTQKRILQELLEGRKENDNSKSR